MDSRIYSAGSTAVICKPGEARLEYSFNHAEGSNIIIISKGLEVIDTMTLTCQPFIRLQSYGKETGSQKVLQTEGIASCYSRAFCGNLNVYFITLCCSWWTWSLVGGIPTWFGQAMAFAPNLCPAGREGTASALLPPLRVRRLFTTSHCIPPAQLSLPT